MSSSRVDMVTLARQLGLSQSTVSRALADKPGVSARTRRRVVAAARDAGYARSAAARRLVSGRTDSVALLVNHPDQWYQSAVIAQATAMLQAAQLDPIVYNMSDPRQRAAVIQGGELSGKVDGILVVSLSLTSDEEDQLAALAVPTVGVGTVLDRFTFVTVDNEFDIAAGVRHLLALNHRRIGLIQGTTDGNRPNYVTQERGHGFRRAMGPHFSEEYVVRVLGNNAEGGGSGLAMLLARDEPPTAIVAETDNLAAGALQAAQRMGISVPAQLSLLGFDDSPIAALLDLTTLRQDPRIHADQATGTLLGYMRDKASEKTFALLPTTLVVRGTTQAYAPSAASV